MFRGLNRAEEGRVDLDVAKLSNFAEKAKLTLGEWRVERGEGRGERSLLRGEGAGKGYVLVGEIGGVEISVSDFEA